MTLWNSAVSDQVGCIWMAVEYLRKAESRRTNEAIQLAAAVIRCDADPCDIGLSTH